MKREEFAREIFYYRDYYLKFFRVFCFFDKERLIIIMNGFQKKSKRTPKGEIEKAEKIRKQYFND
jgi:phage-related protein